MEEIINLLFRQQQIQRVMRGAGKGEELLLGKGEERVSRNGMEMGGYKGRGDYMAVTFHSS